MNNCYLGLGSNQKHPERQLRQAVKAIKSFPYCVVTKISSLHRSKAWGLHRQQDFCNLVVKIKTRLPPSLLLRLCNQTELNQLRVRKRKNGPRTLDIDILLYGERKVKSKELIIPHPRMDFRNFVLVPLLELYPEYCSCYGEDKYLSLGINHVHQHSMRN